MTILGQSGVARRFALGPPTRSRARFPPLRTKKTLKLTKYDKGI